MDQRNYQVSPREFLRVRKVTIGEEIKRFKDFVQQNSNIPELKDEIMDYFQSLRRDLQDIESLVQRGELFVSSNLNGTNLHHGQDVTQQKSDMVMSSNAHSLSCFKRKKRSRVWEDFTKYVGEDGKEWAKCNHCKKKFVGSSKKGTTHLKNHLKSCLKPSGGVSQKEKEKSLMALDLNDSNLVQKIMKYGLNNIKDDILIVYEQEKCKLQGYLEKLPSRFSLRIDSIGSGVFGDNDYWSMRIYFVDDSWELRNKIIYFNDGDAVYEIMKSVLADWKIHRKICSVIDYDDLIIRKEHVENLKNWFKERGSVPFIEASFLHLATLDEIGANLSFYGLEKVSPDQILTKASNLRNYANTSLKHWSVKFGLAEALSEGKGVTLQSLYQDESLFEWIVACKEVFCELEHIDSYLESINFTKEEWDDATLMYGCWQVMKDLKKEIDSLQDASKTVNVYFSMVCHFFLRLDQLRKSDNSYLHAIALCCLEHVVKYWKNSGMVLEISVILDPRCKMEMVERYYKMIYDNDAQAHLHKTIDDVKNFFSNYVNGTLSSCSSHDYNTTLESELNCYLKKEHPEDEGFDILRWWHDKSPIYPTLARIARDLLSIPFKTPHFYSSLWKDIEDILTCKSLDDDFKNKLACTKIWLNTSENN